jgi:hypothetical protein
MLDRDIVSLDPAKLAQTLPQSVCPVRDRIIARALRNKANAGEFLCLFRFDRQTKPKQQSAQ